LGKNPCVGAIELRTKSIAAGRNPNTWSRWNRRWSCVLVYLQGDGYDLGELRAVQDWYVKFALQNVEGVSEVASFGGFQKQYQVSINPNKLIYYNVSAMDVANALKANNRDVGGSIYEMNRMGYMIRGLGYIKDIKDIEEISVGSYKSIPIKMKDVADVQMSSDIRLGIVDENGEGEVVGGVVVARYGENAKEVIDRERKIGRCRKRIATRSKNQNRLRPQQPY
jgi:Cu/Ag efflux pump CusA